MTKKVIILGKSSSGKDTLRNVLIEKGLKPCVAYTTRPIRLGELDGVNYKFVDLEQYNSLKLIESESFNVANGDTWWYGKTKETIEEADVFICTVKGISDLLKHFSRETFFIVELECEQNVRLQRALSRGDEKKELFRRFKADDEDFKRIRDFKVDIKVKSENSHFYEQIFEILDI